MMVQPHYNQQWHTPIGTVFGQLAMYWMCDFADRDFFLKRILQVAIDAYAVAEAEGNRYSRRSRAVPVTIRHRAGSFASPDCCSIMPA